MQQAYLTGLSNYPNHPLTGVPNDLALMQRALRHQDFAPEEMQTFGDESGTLTGLRQVPATIVRTLSMWQTTALITTASSMAFSPILKPRCPLQNSTTIGPCALASG